MLFIDKELKTAQEVADMFGLNLGKIQKAPEFEINEDRRSIKPGGDREMSIPAGTRFHAFFFGKRKGMKDVEIRYAEHITTEPLTPGSDRVVDKYHPYKVKFEGESVLIDELFIDLAVFMYLHPLNEYSPFRGQLKEKFHYSFNDKQLKGEKVVSAGNVLLQAMQKALELQGEAMRVLAKGVGVSGVDQMEDIQVQAELVKRAQNDPAGFIGQAGSNKVIIKGMINAAIDNGLFKEVDSNGRRRWIWGAGDKHGVEIVELFNNNTELSSNTLMEHIFSRINEFLPTLKSSLRTITAQKQSDILLESIEEIDLNEVFYANEFGGGTNEIETTETVNEVENAFDVVEQARKDAGLPPLQTYQERTPETEVPQAPAPQQSNPLPFLNNGQNTRAQQVPSMPKPAAKPMVKPPVKTVVKPKSK
jgi:hypothetical protein